MGKATQLMRVQLSLMVPLGWVEKPQVCQGCVQGLWSSPPVRQIRYLMCQGQEASGLATCNRQGSATMATLLPTGGSKTSPWSKGVAQLSPSPFSSAGPKAMALVL